MANVWCLFTGSRGASVCQVPDCLVCGQGEGHLLGLLDGLQQCGGFPGTPPGRHSSSPLWLEVLFAPSSLAKCSQNSPDKPDKQLNSLICSDERIALHVHMSYLD